MGDDHGSRAPDPALGEARRHCRVRDHLHHADGRGRRSAAEVYRRECAGCEESGYLEILRHGRILSPMNLVQYFRVARPYANLTRNRRMLWLFAPEDRSGGNGTFMSIPLGPPWKTVKREGRISLGFLGRRGNLRCLALRTMFK